MQTIELNISDTVNNIASVKRFQAELEFMGVPSEGVLVRGGVATVYYESALTEQQTQLVNFVWQAHEGGKYPNIQVLASQTMLQGLTEIRNINEWQTIGVQLLRPSKLHPSVPDLIAQCIGEVSVVGSACEVRICEISPDGVESVLTNPHLILPINGGLWEQIDLFSNVPLRDTFNRYEVQCRKNGAGSFIIRNVTTTLVRLL